MGKRSKSTIIDTGAIPTAKEIQIDDTSNDNDWSIQDKIKLISQIKALIPNKDDLPFSETLEDLKWEDIEIGGSYSTTEIREKCFDVIKNIRSYRILTEILKDAEKYLLSTLQIKKPLSTFALFIQENKDEIKKKNAQDNVNYTTTAANIFKSLTEEEKEKYVFKCKKARKVYQTELSKLQLDRKSIKTATNNKKVSNKTFTSAFLYYWEEVKRKDKKANYNSIRKHYTGLNSAEKLKWILKFLGATYGNMLTLQQFKKAVSYLNKDEISILDDYEKRPKKLNTFNIFMQKFIKRVSGSGHNMREIFKNGAESWKNLPATEKLEYKELSMQLKKQYNEDFNAFLESLPEDRKCYEENKNKKTIQSEILNEEKIVKKEKRSRKSKITESEELVTSELPQKVPKLSDQENSTEDITDNFVISENGIFNFDFQLEKPPGSLYKYFVQNVFDGPKEKAKLVFKSLSKRKRERIIKKYEKTKTKYLKDFENYLSSLSAEDIEMISKRINENEGINTSNATESD